MKNYIYIIQLIEGFQMVVFYQPDDKTYNFYFTMTSDVEKEIFNIVQMKGKLRSLNYMNGIGFYVLEEVCIHGYTPVEIVLQLADSLRSQFLSEIEALFFEAKSDVILNEVIKRTEGYDKRLSEMTDSDISTLDLSKRVSLDQYITDLENSLVTVTRYEVEELQLSEAEEEALIKLTKDLGNRSQLN